MCGRNPILLTLGSLVISGMLDAQSPAETAHHAEELLYRDESAQLPISAYEARMDISSHPIDLNSATSDQLLESGLFTPFQAHQLIKQREAFGAFFSIYELRELKGFRESRLRKIAAYLTVEPGVKFTQGKNSRHMMLINTGRTLPEAIGYQSRQEGHVDPAYAGSPLKTSTRIKSRFGQCLSMGVAYEKDAGEKYFQGKQPEFISGYIQYCGNRLLKQIVVGNFQLHHGLGLVNGTGFLHAPERIQIHLNSIANVKPYASLNENRFEQGIGCKMELKNLGLLLWSSYQKLDLSLGDLGEDPGDPDWSERHRKSGLHRTMTELEGRALAFRFHSGIQMVVNQKNLTVGAMVGVEVAGLTQKGIDKVKTGMEPILHGKMSLHGQWHRERLELFGELASGTQPSAAILAGLRYHHNDFIQGLLMLHHYGPSYRGMHPSSYASGSNITNEQGIAVGLHAEPGILFTADFLLELFNYPAPRYLAHVPTLGYRYSCTINNPGIKHLHWRIRIVKKVWQTTPESNVTGIRSFKNSEVTRLDFRFTYNPDVLLRCQSRWVVSRLSGEFKTIPGYAAVQQFSLHPWNSLRCTFQFVVFNVSHWDNRIYLYEPGLYYSFNFPAYYGTGEKITSVVSLKAGKKVTLTARASVTTYHNSASTGSGNELKPGNKKWELEMQLRLIL